MPYKDIWRIGGGVYQNQAINAIKIYTYVSVFNVRSNFHDFLASLGKKKANGINHWLLFFNLLIKQ